MYLGTRVYQTSLAEEAVALLIDFFDSFALSISFPELAIPAIVQFKKYCKRSKTFAANKQILQLIDSLEMNSGFVEKARSAVTFSPKDANKVVRNPFIFIHFFLNIFFSFPPTIKFTYCMNCMTYFYNWVYSPCS
jgi:hypothetical protein